MEYFLPENNSSVLDYRELEKRFGGDQYGFILLKNKKIFGPEVLQQVKRISHFFENKDYVVEISSLTASKDVAGDQYEVRFTPLIKDIPTSEEEAILLKEKIYKDALFKEDDVQFLVEIF